MNCKYRYKGYIAMLGLLIVVAIGLVIYAIQAGTFFNDGKVTTAFNMPDPAEDKPWMLEDLIAGPSDIIDMPRPPRPVIDKLIVIQADVKTDDLHRGKINIRFNNLGEVKGKWRCSWQTMGQKHSYSADFKGNISVDRVCKHNGNEDKSKLFFIAKGSYVKTDLITENQRTTTEQGIIYVTGCMDPDYSVNGKITLTTDKSWTATYQFQN